MPYIHVPIKPMPYKRARKGSHGGIYVPRDYQEYRDELAVLLRNGFKLRMGKYPMQGPVAVGIEFEPDGIVVEVAPTTPRAKGFRGDLDNYVKAVLDAAEGELFDNDRQVKMIMARFMPAELSQSSETVLHDRDANRAKRSKAQRQTRLLSVDDDATSTP